MSTSVSTKSTARTAKKTKIITLRLPSDQLEQFPADVPSRKPSTSAKPDPSPSVPTLESAEKWSESNATPVPPAAENGTDGNSLAPPKVDGRRKRGGAAVSGKKRAPPTIDPDHPPRERGRPGPKKKPRLPDGTIDRSQDSKKGPVAGPNPVPTHRLGPKANTGNINANLRALDRTGKPCRRWERKGLQLKSFTGTIWNMPSWKAPQRDSGFAGDVKSDTTGSSDLKPNDSSAVASERSNSGVDGGDAMLTNGVDSSPAPPVVA